MLFAAAPSSTSTHNDYRIRLTGAHLRVAAAVGRGVMGAAVTR